MNTKLFVGNLSFDTTENDLQDLFAEFGPVNEVNLVTDRATGRSRGFAFVTLASVDSAKAAIEALSNKNVGGRTISVSEARPREERSGGGGGGRRDGGGGDRGERGDRDRGSRRGPPRY